MKYIILIFLCLTSKIAWAQYEDEHEIVANDPYGSGAARKAQVKSLWSLSDPNFNFKEVSSDGGWHTERVKAHIQPIKVSQSTRGQINSYGSKKSSRSQTGTHVYTNPNFMQLRRQQIAKAQERASEERRRREEEKRRQRALNMAKTAQIYNQSMAKTRAEYASRDRWMATEGNARLEQIHAVDFANVPQGKAEPKLNTLSGKEMAEMLKNKEKNDGGITVVWDEKKNEYENRKNVAIGKHGKYIELYGDGGYDQDELDLWKQALFSESPAISVGTSKDIERWEKTLLIESQWFNLDSFNIMTLPEMGCVALIGDSILLFDNDSLSFLSWGIEDITQVVTCGERVFGKQGCNIVEIKGNELELVCELNDDKFDVYAETDSTFIVCASFVDLFVITRVNIIKMLYDELLRTPTTIRKVVSNGSYTFALLKARLIDISETPKLFYLSKTRINDVCMCRSGMLLATDENILLLKSPQEVLLFSDEGASRLWCDGSDVYLIDKKGNLLRYSK